MASDDSMKALIDTDFLTHIADVKSVDPLQAFQHYCEDAKVDVSMHERVYSEEAMSFPATEQFFSCGIVAISRFIATLTLFEKELYKRYINYLFSSYKNIPYPFEDVFEGWQKQCSFGEIHSMALCILHSYSLFLSDDKDSQRIHIIAKKNFEGKSIRVLNRKSAIDSIESYSSLTRAERRALSHI